MPTTEPVVFLGAIGGFIGMGMIDLFCRSHGLSRGLQTFSRLAWWGWGTHRRTADANVEVPETFYRGVSRFSSNPVQDGSFLGVDGGYADD
jgi:hypothetical protein